MSEHNYKFNVTMTCGGCSGAVERVLKKMDGELPFPSLPDTSTLVRNLLPAGLHHLPRKMSHIASQGMRDTRTRRLMRYPRCEELQRIPRHANSGYHD
jgi:copper chaperone CopZ